MLTNPCNLSLNPVNTGVECQAAMAATAMLILVPKNATFTDADITTAGSFTALVETKAHLPAAQRWYPLFGFSAAINGITESNESDVLETLDDGSQIFVRYGKFNRTFMTTSGGLCLAAHLMSFPGGYSFIEVDIKGQVLVYQKTPGLYAGVPTNMIKGLGPELANFKTSYKNRLMLSFDPVAYVKSGQIFSSDATENILGVTGLLDTDVTKGVGTQTVTNLFVGVKTECAQTDLVALYPTEIVLLTNYILNNPDGTVNTPTSASIVGGEVKFIGTFTSPMKVALAAANILKTNGIEGYDGTGKVTITFP